MGSVHLQEEKKLFAIIIILYTYKRAHARAHTYTNPPTYFGPRVHQSTQRVCRTISSTSGLTNITVADIQFIQKCFATILRTHPHSLIVFKV